jgi:hypothetical protein
MKSIFNLVLFLSVIFMIIIICNFLIKKNQDKPVNDEHDSNEDNIDKKYETFKNQKKNIPSGKLTFDFNYDTVPPVKEKFDLKKSYYTELKTGATVVPQYTNNTFSDQKVIHDNRMYEKPIHRYRTLEIDENNNLPTKISELFDKSITDFKQLTPLKDGYTGEFASEGGFNLASYNPDFIGYNDEKPENGGIIPNLYNTVYGNDPLLQTSNALF